MISEWDAVEVPVPVVHEENHSYDGGARTRSENLVQRPAGQWRYVLVLVINAMVVIDHVCLPVSTFSGLICLFEE